MRIRVYVIIFLSIVLVYGFAGNVFPIIEFGLGNFEKARAVSSSFLKEKGKPENYYSPDKAIDGKPETAWCQGKKNNGIGEYIHIRFSPVFTSKIHVLNGFGADKNLYFSNNRIRGYEVTVTFKDGTSMVRRGELKDNKCLSHYNDTPGSNHRCRWQVDPDYDDQPDVLVDFGTDNPKCVTALKIKILSVYPGTRFSDTCIAEISPIWNGAWELVVPDFHRKNNACCGKSAQYNPE